MKNMSKEARKELYFTDYSPIMLDFNLLKPYGIIAFLY
jgi:hypothetical protein